MEDGMTMKRTIVLVLVMVLAAGWGGASVWGEGNGTSEGGAGKAEEAKKPAFEVSFEEGHVSVRAVQADCHEVLVRLAEEAGMSLVVDDTVNAKITANLTGLTPLQAVSAISLSAGLVMQEVGGSVVVSTGIPERASSYLRSEIVGVPTKYVLADTAKSLLPQFLYPYVKVNQSQNALVLSGPPQALEKFRSDVAKFDIPASQIMLEILMVELTKSAAKQLASTVEWSNAGQMGALDTGTGEISFQALGTLPKEFSVTLHALAEKGSATVHANPRIATLSGHTAKIFVGITQYLYTPITTGGGTGNSIEAGVSLDMTPWTGGPSDGERSEIIVSLSPSVTTLGAIDPATKLPEKTTREASTTVRVGAGQTIVIGGLVQHEAHETRRGVPVLRELPLIGPAFESHSVAETDTELVVFVTPTIITGEGIAGGGSAAPLGPGEVGLDK
jgi:type II secretory pathway component GspD/PulD (secretin)